VSAPRRAPAGEDEKPTESSGGSFPAWLLFIVLITVEYLVISNRIDAKDLLDPTGLSGWLGGIGTLAPLAFVTAIATFVVGGRTVREGFRLLATFRTSRLLLAFLGVLHAGLYVASFRVAKVILAEPTPWKGWVFIWFGLVAASACLLAASFWSFSRMAMAFRQARRGIVAGLSVGAVAFGAGLLSTLLWPSLARLTLELVHAVLTLVTPDPVAAPGELLVGTARFYVQVAPVCSGIEGIGLTLTFTGAYLYLCRADLRWPRAFVLLPASVVAIWLLNVVRIAGLVVVGTWGWPDIALGGFHSKAGWVFFSVVALGAVVLTQKIRWFRRPTQDASPAEASPAISENRTAVYLMPMLAILAVALLTGMFSSGFDLFYFLRIPAVAVVLWHYRRRLPKLDFRRPWLSLALGLAVGIVWMWGTHGGSPDGKSAMAVGLGQLSPPVKVLWLWARIVGSVLVAPLVEELAFRGFLMRRLVSRNFESVSYRRVHWAALAVSSLAFGFLHSQWALGILAGAAYGLVMVPYGRLSDAVIAHVASNLSLVVYALVSRDWSLLS
jgi:exosortase E/protease (VPEID-CTERM system)